LRKKQVRKTFFKECDSFSGEIMAEAENRGHQESHKDISRLSISELITEIREQVSLLVKKEVDLAKAELKADLKAEALMAGGFLLAAIFGFLTVSMLCVTAILAIAIVLPGWAAGLIVSGFLLLMSLIAALIGWGSRVKAPLVRTREAIRSDISMTKEGFA
jgi:uncharacterized membrane protein YqjE